MIPRPVVLDGGMAKALQPGDNSITGEVLPAAVTATATTITGAQLQNGWIARNPAAAGTDTIDSAANLVAQMSQGLGTKGIQNGTSFRACWFNDSANAITIAASANSGVTVNKPTVNANSVKDFLVTVVNGTPATTLLNASVTNGSAVVNGLTDEQLSGVSPGMVLTNAFAGLQGVTVLGVNRTNNTLTMSANANATTVGTLNLSPVVVVQGIGQKAM